MTAARVRVCTLSLIVILPFAALASAGQNPAQTSKSAALAAELAKLLDDKKLDSIAAKNGDAYVGALYFAGTQLLVVGAKYPAAERMNFLLSTKAYRDAYIDLNSASDRATRVFVSDLGANGLRFRRERDQPFDSVDVGGKAVDFDGDWGKAKISEAEYTKQFQSTDEQYVQMLQALIDAAKKPS